MTMYNLPMMYSYIRFDTQYAVWISCRSKVEPNSIRFGTWWVERRLNRALNTKRRSNSGVWVLALHFLVLHLASARFSLRLDSVESQASPSISPVQFLSFCCLISVHLIYCNIWRRNRLLIHRHSSRVMCFLWHMLHIYSWCFVTSQWPIFSLL